MMILTVLHVLHHCNNILFGMFAMCKPMISEPLVYRLYVWCAITFYLACLRCANRLFLTQGCKLPSPIHPDKVLILLMAPDKIQIDLMTCGLHQGVYQDFVKTIFYRVVRQ